MTQMSKNRYGIRVVFTVVSETVFTILLSQAADALRSETGRYE